MIVVFIGKCCWMKMCCNSANGYMCTDAVKFKYAIPVLIVCRFREVDAFQELNTYYSVSCLSPKQNRVLLNMLLLRKVSNTFKGELA